MSGGERVPGKGNRKRGKGGGDAWQEHELRRALKKQQNISSEFKANNDMVPTDSTRKFSNENSVPVGDMQTPDECKAGEGLRLTVRGCLRQG